MNIACLFGSFNPPHNGHLKLARYVAELDDIDQVWIIVSPHNPFKNLDSLLDEHVRYKMVENMTEDYDNISACDVELSLTKPSFTYKTLEYLKQNHQENTFHYIIGSDSVNHIDTWENYEDIIKFPFLIFIRNGEELSENINSIIKNKRIFTIDDEKYNISSTYIRNYIKNNDYKSLEKHICPKNLDIIIKNKYYI